MKYLIDENTLTDIADEIREKTGKSEEIKVKDMATEISTISGGGVANFLIDDFYYVSCIEGSTVYDTYIKKNEEEKIDFSIIAPLISNKPKHFDHCFCNSLTKTIDSNNNIFNYILDLNMDFSETKSFNYTLKTLGVNIDGQEHSCGIINKPYVFKQNFKSTAITSVSNSLLYFNPYNKTKVGKPMDWTDDVYIDIDWSECSIDSITNFQSYLQMTTMVRDILNIRMPRITNTSNTLSSCKFRRLTFQSSFGGNSTTSSLTLNFSYNTRYTHDAFMETMNSLSANTNGKTRIFKVSATIYDSLTEEELDLIEDKGYSVSK